MLEMHLLQKIFPKAYTQILSWGQCLGWAGRTSITDIALTCTTDIVLMSMSLTSTS